MYYLIMKKTTSIINVYLYFAQYQFLFNIEKDISIINVYTLQCLQQINPLYIFSYNKQNKISDLSISKSFIHPR